MEILFLRAQCYVLIWAAHTHTHTHARAHTQIFIPCQRWSVLTDFRFYLYWKKQIIKKDRFYFDTRFEPGSAPQAAHSFQIHTSSMYFPWHPTPLHTNYNLHNSERIEPSSSELQSCLQHIRPDTSMLYVWDHPSLTELNPNLNNNPLTHRARHKKRHLTDICSHRWVFTSGVCSSKLQYSAWKSNLRHKTRWVSHFNSELWKLDFKFTWRSCLKILVI